MPGEARVSGEPRQDEVLVRGNMDVVAQALPVQTTVPNRLMHEGCGGGVRGSGGGGGGGGAVIRVVSCRFVSETEGVVLAKLGTELLHWTPHCVIRRA